MSSNLKGNIDWKFCDKAVCKEMYFVVSIMF